MEGTNYVNTININSAFSRSCASPYTLTLDTVNYPGCSYMNIALDSSG